ncbi:MAG: hypothetical protein AAFR09_00880 [Pseudomonadota bacterium]
MTNTQTRRFVKGHWFLIIAPLVLLADALVAHSGPIDRFVEAGLLFDLVLLMPALYFLCYRKRRQGAGVRALGLACLGVWIATKLVPDSDRVLLVYLGPLRYVGLAVLVLIELALIRMIFRMLSAGGSAEATAKHAADAADMPTWVAKLLVWEAGLWRRFFAGLRRLARRRSEDD